jgi:ADP-heptose:LPS heptosyltransferase
MELARAERVLVCLRWGIGDLVMELPLLTALRGHVPRAVVTGLGAAPALELLEGEGVVDRLRAVQDFGVRHWGDTGSDVARTALADWFRQQRFDIVLDTLHAPQAVQRVLWRLGLPGRDTGWFAPGEVESEEAAPGGAVPAPADGSARLAAAAAVTWQVRVDPAAPPTVRLTPRELEDGARRKSVLAGTAPLHGVAPIASSPLKRGAAAEFARVADGLVAATDGYVALFAGDQYEVARAVRARMTRPERAHLVPALHLRRTAALLARCRGLVCNDTGLMHLAAAVRTPVVAVFACTSPRLYLPRSAVAVQRWRHPCSFTDHDDFGVNACVARGRCLDPDHERVDDWWRAALDAALAGFRRREPEPDRLLA